MRKTFYLIISLFVLAVAVSCKDSKPKAVTTQTDGETDTLAAGDSTVYGTMIDGGMNSLVLLTDNGDTVVYLVNPDDTIDVVKGGKLNGDRFAIIGYTESPHC